MNKKIVVGDDHLQEKRIHGIENFPCSLYRSAGEKLPLNVKHHWHKELEILYFISGVYQVEVNMEKYHIEKECFCFINSGELHYIKSEVPFRQQAVVFHPFMLKFEEFDNTQKKVIEPVSDGSLRLPRVVDYDHPVFAFLKKEFLQIGGLLHGEAMHGDSMSENPVLNKDDRNGEDFAYEGNMETTTAACDQLLIKASLLKILAYLKKYNLILESQESTDYRIEIVKRVLLYIQTHYTEKIYVADLAAEANMNEQYFCRFFKKAIGKTPVEYLNEYRIKKAMKLLLSSHIQITEIGMECGFNNLGNFMKEFRRITGTTPLRYRKKINNKG